MSKLDTEGRADRFASAQRAAGERSPLLEIRGLRVSFRTDAGPVPAVRGVDLALGAGETLALVGESGCGKSVTALSILRLVATPPGAYDAGEIRLEGEDLLRASEERIREVRGNDVAMIFQEPMTSLNPVFPVGEQVAEAIELHQDVGAGEARARAIEALHRVGIPAPEQRADEYPHQLSGGLRQRVMIAMALACNPRVLIADEPTTALDVTIQAQILELIAKLQAELGMAVLLITHDLGVVAETAHRVAVMYAGRVVEEAQVLALFERPRHPYTAGLLRSRPRLDVGHGRLVPIEGTVPDALHVPAGCAFHPRCPLAVERCRREEPPLVESAGHRFACWVTAEQPGLDLLAGARP
jgi:oligopeptide/dipeptide ABC transporter ATP-binding protein